MRTRPILAAAALLLAAGLAAVTHGVVSQADEPLRIGTTYMTMNNPFYSVIDEELRLVIESRRYSADARSGTRSGAAERRNPGSAA